MGKQFCQKADVGEEKHEQKPLSRGEAGRKALRIRTDSCSHVPAPWLQRLLLVSGAKVMIRVLLPRGM